MRFKVIVVGLTVALALAAPDAHAQKVTCTKAAEAQAKEHYDRAEAFKTLDKFREAVKEYLVAFETCGRPFLLFNAAQMAWLDGEKQEALMLYERYLALDPKGRAAPVAREQFFEAAEHLRASDKLEEALKVYERYVELAPRGDDAGVARTRMDEIRGQLRERDAEAAAEAERQAEEARQAEEERRAEEERQAEAKRQAEASAGEPSGGGSLDWKPLAVAGSGAAIVILGGVLHAQALSAGESYDRDFASRCPVGCSEAQVPELTSQLDGAESKQRVAIAAYAVGGLAMAGGIAWLVLQYTRAGPDREAADSSMSFTPLAGPDLVGGAWHIRF